MIWSILNTIIHTLQYFLDRLYDIRHFKSKGAVLPPISNPILLMPMTTLASKIRSRELKSENVIKAFINRIQVINPILNCFIMTNNRFQEAIEKGKEIDNLLDTNPNSPEISQKLKPFLGVPFTSKEAFKITGCTNSSGLLTLKDNIASEDALVVKHLKDAGALAIGVTTVPELCMWWETNNNVYGRTKNAYDSRRIVGGSSGGECCLISAAGSVGGIGSDIGGSIRMPAFFNGIYGHKPSRFLISNEGQLPGDSKNDAYLSTGPLCRYVEDLLPMFIVMAGPATWAKMQDPLQDPLISMRHHRLGVKKLKVLSIPDVGNAIGVSPVSSEQKIIQKRVEIVLQNKLNATVKVIRFKEFEEIFVMWNACLSLAGAPSFCETMGLPSNVPINPWKELFLWFFGTSKHTIPAIGLALTEKLNGMSLEEKEQYKSKTKELEKKIVDLLGDFGVLLMPSNADYAYYHNQPIHKSFNCIYTMIFNILGLPVTQVPLGLGQKGVPLGIQVVSTHNNDRLTIAVAKVLDREFGGWVEPHSEKIIDENGNENKSSKIKKNSRMRWTNYILGPDGWKNYIDESDESDEFDESKESKESDNTDESDVSIDKIRYKDNNEFYKDNKEYCLSESEDSPESESECHAADESDKFLW